MRADKKLTQRDIDSARPRLNEYTLWDLQISGFGLRIRPSGAKSYVFVYRYDGRKSRRYTIGNPNIFTLDEARKKARTLAQDVAYGEDPAKNKVVARRTTVESVYQMYEEWFRAQWRIGHQTRVKGIFRSLVIPMLGQKPIRAVTRSDIRSLTDQKISDGKKAMANNIHRSMSAFLSWCVDREFLNINPLSGANLPFKKQSRDRCLTRDELVMIWRACNQLEPKWRTAIHLLMLTAQRRSEVLGAEVREFDIQSQRWTLPAERSKNHFQHTIHLSPQAIAVIKAMPYFSGQKYLFQSDRRFRSDSLFATRSIMNSNASLKRLKNLVGIDNWRLHDLRRSVATHMARLEVSPHIISVILNHRSGFRTGVTAIYNRYTYDREAQEALDLWGSTLEKWVNDPSLPTPVIKYDEEVVI